MDNDYYRYYRYYCLCHWNFDNNIKMSKVSITLVLFEWINILLTVYLLYKIIFQTPLICVNTVDTALTLFALIIYLIGRILKEIREKLKNASNNLSIKGISKKHS